MKSKQSSNRSASHQASVKKYNQKTYESITFRVKKDREPSRTVITAAAERKGMSLNAYIVEAITEKMHRDSADIQSGGTEYEKQLDGPVIHASVYPKE